MDLSGFNTSKAASKPHFLQLSHPATGELLANEDGKKIGIDLLGADSSEYQNARRRWQTSRMSKRNKNPTIAEIEAAAIEWLAAVTVKFHNIEFDGEKANEKAAADVYRDHAWIREQVEEFINDRANFFQNA